MDKVTDSQQSDFSRTEIELVQLRFLDTKQGGSQHADLHVHYSYIFQPKYSVFTSARAASSVIALSEMCHGKL